MAGRRPGDMPTYDQILFGYFLLLPAHLKSVHCRISDLLRFPVFMHDTTTPNEFTWEGLANGVFTLFASSCRMLVRTLSIDKSVPCILHYDGNQKASCLLLLFCFVLLDFWESIHVI